MEYILVTGACGGMGKAAVKELVNRGYGVFALDKTKYEEAKNVIPIVADVTDLQSLKLAFEKVSLHTRKLYAIMHFAGIYMLNSLVEIGKEDFENAFRINLFGAFNINKIFLPLLKEGSRILITTSELAPLSPLPFTGLYAVTKSALDKYAYSLRMELQLLGIKVSVLRAGAVKTNMLGVSTAALDNFCANTKLYLCNAERFKKIVNNVEAKNIPPEKLAKRAANILNKNHPKFAYAINRNPLLLLLNILPSALQFWVIKQILK